MNIHRRQFLTGALGLLATGSAGLGAARQNTPDQRNFMQRSWRLDPRCVLPRGPEGSIDSRIAGDPCIVWDEHLGKWRMFYFSSGQGAGTGLALSAGSEKIGSGDWEKIGAPKLENRDALLDQKVWHKWWVVMDIHQPNRAARIDGQYWALVVSVKRVQGGSSQKNIQVAHAASLAGPWTVVKQPILSPTENYLDGRHCDTPAAYWMPDKQRVAIFYKGYPLLSQEQQPGAAFGSGTILADWHPREAAARKVKIILRPGVNDTWLKGWISTPQLFFDARTRNWYGLINGSPTPPADVSHREPSPSLGGWIVCDGENLEGPWRIDTTHSPFRTPEQLTRPELDAGLGENFWRHHLLVTPDGQARIYFNSGQYGHEQMYSLVAEPLAK